MRRGSARFVSGVRGRRSRPCLRVDEGEFRRADAHNGAVFLMEIKHSVMHVPGEPIFVLRKPLILRGGGDRGWNGEDGGIGCRWRTGAYRVTG
jgi:hypothetical protein